MGTFFTDIPDIELVKSISSNSNLLNIINKLEGIKTRLKELHWNSASTSLVKHRFIDEVLTEVIEFQDDLAENLQAFNGVIKVGTLCGELPESTDIKGVINEVLDIISTFESQYKNNPEYTGAININEGATSAFRRLQYLALPF